MKEDTSCQVDLVIKDIIFALDFLSKELDDDYKNSIFDYDNESFERRRFILLRFNELQCNILKFIDIYGNEENKK